MKAFKRKIFSFLIAYFGKFFLRLILSTCDIEIKGTETFKATISSKKSILMLWHNRLTIVSELLFKVAPTTIFTAFISKSRDGDALAVLANSYKTGKAIRVAHDKRHHALKEIIESLKNKQDVLIITPDGPRGPRYEVKPGIVTAALETSASVIPLSWISNKFWQLRSWDKMIFPKPFSKIIVTFGEPILLKEKPSQENEKLLKEHLLAIDEKMNATLFETRNNYPK